MNARIHPALIARLSTLVLASLPLATVALAAQAPAIDEIDVLGARCLDADDDNALPEGVPTLARTCHIDGDSTLSWTPVAGAAAYQIDVWGSYGEGLQEVSSFTTADPKLPIQGGNSGYYVVAISSVDPGGQLGEPEYSIALEITAQQDAPQPADDDSKADDGTPADANQDADNADGSADQGVDPVVAQEVRIAALEAELDAAYDDVDDAWTAIDTLKNNNARLHQRLTESNSRIAQLEGANAALTLQNAHLLRLVRHVTGHRPTPN